MFLSSHGWTKALDQISRRWPSGFRGLGVRAGVAPLLLCFLRSLAQDWVKTGTSLGVEKVRLAVPDFKPSS